MRITRQPSRAPAIDMTPMIDCVFQLLIFFMLSSSFATPMIQLNLPRSRTTDERQAAEIMVTVDAQGQYFLDRERINANQLEGLLRPRIAESKHKVVTFRGDEKTNFQHFVRVFDAAKASGAAHIDIQHLEEK